jgi:transglutaminase-like putative cysteine protease
VPRWPESFSPYLQSETQAVVINDGLTKLLDQIVPRRTTPYRDLETVLQWVDSHFTYDHVQASLGASSLHAFENQRGHCSDYHGFCAAMGRMLGYPTRVTYGINPFPKNSPSHCKLEIFLPPYGWVSFDVSETQKLAAQIRKDATLSAAEQQMLVAAAARRLHRGFRDNTWFLQTRGTDYDLAPPASRRVAVVRTIYAEADGQPLPEPDPAAEGRREFSWMTIHDYVPDRQVSYPFKDVASLAPEASGGDLK